MYQSKIMIKQNQKKILYRKKILKKIKEAENI